MNGGAETIAKFRDPECGSHECGGAEPYTAALNPLPADKQANDGWRKADVNLSFNSKEDSKWLSSNPPQMKAGFPATVSRNC
jgi:hypothetical protein